MTIAVKDLHHGLYTILHPREVARVDESLGRFFVSVSPCGLELT